jgi:hypothetical protein
VPGLSAGNGALYMNTMIRGKILSAMRRLNINVEPVGRLPEPCAGRSARSARDHAGAAADLQRDPDDRHRHQGRRVAHHPADRDAGHEQRRRRPRSTPSGSAAQRGRPGRDRPLPNGGVDVRDLGEQQAKPALRTRIEFFCGLAVFGGKAAARGRGVLNS